MSKRKHTKPLIFIADDDADDRDFISSALELLIPSDCLRFFQNGKDLLQALRKNDQIPNLILLDLNMPLISGFEALDYIRKTWRAEDLPVVVLSTSNAERDKIKCVGLGANRYINKPDSISQYEKIAKDLMDSIFDTQKRYIRRSTGII